MKKDKCNLRGLLCTLLVLLAAVCTGCGGEDSVGTGGKSKEGMLSRAEYIGMLGSSFGYDAYISESDIFSDVSSENEYYAQIQAAAEWGIIDREEAFEPDREASLEFALESAVRAIGTDDIEASGAAFNPEQLADFYVSNIAQIDISSGEAPIDAATAGQIIEYAENYDRNLVLPQVAEMELAEGVKTAGIGIRLNADGATGLLAPSDGYSVGDIVYFDATDTSLARAVKITGIEGEVFTFEEASVEETYAYINVRGTFPGKVVEAVSASDGANAGLAQDIYDEMKRYNSASAEGEYFLTLLSNSAKVDKGSDHIIFTAEFDVQKSAGRSDMDGEAAANGKLVVGVKNISTDVTYEHAFLNPLKPKEIKFNFHFDTEISTEIHGSAAVSIPLGEAYIQVWGPLNVKVMLTAHLGADGNVSISYTTANVLSAGWKKGTGLYKDFNSNAKADFQADATLTAEATMLADLRVGFKSISSSVVNAQITSGAVAVGKVEADLLGEQPTCVDLQLYVPLSWGLNQEGCLITDINKDWKYSAVIWNSENSPVKLHMHLEDWKRMSGDICTRTEVVEQELTTPEGEPLEEINPFDFEPIEFDFIELVSYAMYLGEGESLNIGFANIPEGYAQSDLKYEVSDPAVCSVSDGTVKGNAAGSTVVKISTGDGMFTVTLAVTVNEDYSIEGFQTL
ncbi:MAG: Ig-like domain-containing protein [Butyrivibrio sp.]|nr:Ig-like domain-containing protein [Acetatifactor muris]MCM1558520.1 Ig-like domain-containing protein [Butyrivibrio sp.]